MLSDHRVPSFAGDKKAVVLEKIDDAYNEIRNIKTQLGDNHGDKGAYIARKVTAIEVLPFAVRVICWKRGKSYGPCSFFRSL